MCRDAFRAKCARDECDGVATCRDYTLCPDCREGTEEEWF